MNCFVFLHLLVILLKYTKSIVIIQFAFNHKTTMDDLVLLDIIDFDDIVGMDWFHAYYASIDSNTRVVKF